MIFYLLNKGQQTVKLLNNDETIESNLDEAINTASELKFSLPLQKRLDSNIYYILIPEYRENDFLMFKVISEDVQKDRVEYSAVESAYDELKSYAYIRDIRPHQMNAAQMLQQVLKNTRWSLGYVEDTGIQSTTFYYVTILEAIQKIVDLFKVELTFTIQLDPVTQKITGRRVNLYQQQGRRTGKRFEYGSNLLTVTREEDSQNLVTALVGRGKGIQVSGQNTEDTTDDGYGRRLTFADVEWKTSAGAPVNKPKGQEYVEDPKATALYGFSDGHPRIGLVTFEDIEDPNQLINATWSALLEAKRPKVSFKAEVTDVGNLQLGDTIAIIRHDLGIEYFTRVYKVHHNLKDENRNTVEMGDDFSNRSTTSAISNAIQISQDATTIANTAAIAANGKNRNFYSNTKPLFANEGDNLFLNLGNGETEMWVWHHGQWEFVQSTVELHTVQKEVKEAQSGLSDAKKQIADNLAKADGDIAELNASIRDQKKAFDTDIDELNASIRDQKGTIDGLSTTVNTVVIPKVTDVTNKVSDTITKVNEQKNIVTELQNQATQQGKDISKITADVHGVTVDLANLNGDVNQTKATVQGLQSTLGNAQGDIAQIKVDAKKLETSLSSKVDNSNYATFVNQTNQALNAKLVASDLNGYAKTTDLQATANGLQLNINSVTDKLNNLRIGADNLLNGTGNLKDYLINTGGKIDEFSKTDFIPPIQNHPEITAYVHTWEDGQSAYSKQKVLLEKDKTYWFGFYVCTDSSYESPCTNLNIYSNEDDNVSNAKFWGYLNAKDYSFWNKAKYWIWHAIKIVGDGKVYQNFRVEPSGKIGGGSAYFAGYTLVQSDIEPTGYVSSFEDTNHELSQLSAQITANNQKFSSYYTKIETDNRANSAKNDAVNAIKNDNNWHGLSNILTNSGFLQNADGFIQKVQQTMQPIINENNSGGVNLLTNTYTLRNFNNNGNAGEAAGFGIESGDSHKNELNAGEISTNIFHIYAKDLNHAPVYFGQNFTLPKGTWTLSFLVRHNGSSEQKIRLSFYTDDCANRGWIPLGTSDEIDNIWKRHQITFTTTQETFEQNPRLHTPTDDGIPGSSLYFANFKLESGSIATTWCPAPEDYATQTSFSELNQTIKGLQSTVSNNYTNLQSQLSQTAGTISTVVGKVNNLEIATNVQVVDHGIDLNTYKSTGTWFVKGAGTNAPESTWFYLEVKTALDGRVVQTWQRDDRPTHRYVRTYTDNQWSNWERSASYSEYSTLNQTVKGLQSTVSNNHGELKSQISQTATTIRGELTNKITGLQTQLTNTAEGLNAKIGAIQVGGRNLLIDTDLMSSQYWTAESMKAGYRNRRALGTNNACLHTQGNPWIAFNYKQKVIFDTSKEYTFSAYVCSLQKGQSVTLWLNTDDTYQGSFQSATLTNSTDDYDWRRLSITFKPTRTEAYLSIGAFNITTGQDVWLSSLKLEEGNIATDYTHAPEDAEQAFAEVNATINGLKSTVSGNYGTLNSQISQTAKTIRQEVSDKTNGLQTQINQQANNFNVSLNSLRNETAWQKVTSAIDANNYKTTGNYWIQAVPNSNTPDSSAWAYLQVVAYPDVKRIKQTWQRDNNENEIYTRLLIGDNWTSWQRTVTGGNIMAQINMSAGTTLIQNEKIYMDASSTVFSGKAFIPDAAIANISADKINTGTLDAGRINVINLNASNITTGTINGANLKIDLNSGEILFQKGRIGSTNGYLNIDIDSGKMSVTNWRKEGFYFEDGELYLSDSFALTTNWKPKYGVIRRSNNPFTVGESGIEITSPTGVSLQTMNYDGGFAAGGILDQTKNGASVAVDENGQALINGKQVGLTGGTFFDTDQNVLQRRPRIIVGTDAANSGLNSWGSGNPLTHVASRIVIDASYVHFPNSYNTTTGSAPNVFIASDGALVRSTSASKYKTEIKRSYSTEYGEKLLNLPTAIWTDKGQKERYEAGKRHIKPEKYFGMIAEDLADAGLDLLVSRNPLTHEIEGIQYERIAPALLPVIKKLKDKVNELEKKINE